MEDCFYTQVGSSTFESSPRAAGPWSASTQHAGPPSALLVRAMERHEPRADARFGRVTVDILGPVPVGRVDISVELLRAGKRVELLQAAAAVGGKVVLIGRGWRIARAAEGFPAARPAEPIPAPIPPGREIHLPGAHMDGYMSAIDWRFEKGSFDSFGPATAWARPIVPLLPDEEPSPWQRTMIVADSASGLSLTAHPRQYPAINCDLTVVLHRDPLDEWICLDAETTVSPGAGAMTEGRISDRYGSVGISLQTLFASAV